MLGIHVKDNIFQVWILCGLVPHLDHGTTNYRSKHLGL